MNLDIRQILSILFALLLTWLVLFFYLCSASFHLNKAIKKGAQIETRIDTVRYYFKDSIIKNGQKEYFYNYRDTIVQNNTVYVPKTRWQTRTEYKIIKEQIQQDAKTKREEIKQDAKTDRKEIAKEKKTSFSSTLKFLGIILGLVLLIIVLLKSNKKIGL